MYNNGAKDRVNGGPNDVKPISLEILLIQRGIR